MFRVSFASERFSIRIEEELKLVRSYLETEQLRLGSKLHTEIDVDETALRTEVPVLSIQPLVENAVKHGVAARADEGFVRLRIFARENSVSVEVTNSGAFIPDLPTGGTGVGLTNVRRRLILYFGESGALAVSSTDDITTVRFRCR
ncbi:MAG: two-component system, LytTR family, sensor kinase [Bryobacterales bacterium]|nr:two-component system, LytTR family, sensor kinase [Bryobacterales bacterium]